MNTVASLPAAGRDLDALVAERIMGFWFEDDQWWTKHRDGGSRAYATAYLHLWGPNYRSDGLPKFSEDIAAAWEIVEKLRSDGLHFKIDSDTSLWTISPLSFVGWIASFVRDGKHYIGFADTEYGETIAVAICRAALKAVAP